MVSVDLVPMTAQDLEDFIRTEIADYAEARVGEGDWTRREALDRARADLTNVVTWERETLVQNDRRLWTATDMTGARVGWLWVKLASGPSGACAFLCQMTVARDRRGRGYGRAMLSALESLLAEAGVTELHLNVCESNVPAKHLYLTAGYELAWQYPTMCQLRKCLDVPAQAAGMARQAS